VPEATACPPSVVADTIVCTIGLGVTITDAAVEEKVTTTCCAPVARDRRCPDCGREGRYRDTVTRALTDLAVAGYPLCCRSPCPVIAAFPLSVGVRCSMRISGSWPHRGPARRGGVSGMCCGGG